MKPKKITAILLAISLISIFSFTNAFAVEQVATVPVLLTVSNEYRNFSVTVPAQLPINITNGVLTTANNAKIINNSKYTKIKISDIKVTNGAFKVDSYDNFSGNKKSVAMKINGIPTEKEGSMNLTDSSFTILEPESSVPIKYYAKISKDVSEMKDVQIANVIFTITTAE